MSNHGAMSTLHRRIVALLAAVLLLACSGCHSRTGSGSSAGNPTFQPTPLPGRLNIAGLGLGVRAETLAPSFQWNRATHDGIHAFELDPRGLTQLVDGLPLQLGAEVIAAYGTPSAAIEKALGKPDRRAPGELRYDSPGRLEKILVATDDHDRVTFVRIQTTAPPAPPLPHRQVTASPHPAPTKSGSPAPRR